MDGVNVPDVKDMKNLMFIIFFFLSSDCYYVPTKADPSIKVLSTPKGDVYFFKIWIPNSSRDVIQNTCRQNGDMDEYVIATNEEFHDLQAALEGKMFQNLSMWIKVKLLIVNKRVVEHSWKKEPVERMAWLHDTVTAQFRCDYQCDEICVVLTQKCEVESHGHDIPLVSRTGQHLLVHKHCSKSLSSYLCIARKSTSTTTHSGSTVSTVKDIEPSRPQILEIYPAISATPVMTSSTTNTVQTTPRTNLSVSTSSFGLSSLKRSMLTDISVHDTSPVTIPSAGVTPLSLSSNSIPVASSTPSHELLMTTKLTPKIKSTIMSTERDETSLQYSSISATPSLITFKGNLVSNRETTSITFTATVTTKVNNLVTFESPQTSLTVTAASSIRESRTSISTTSVSPDLKKCYCPCRRPRNISMVELNQIMSKERELLTVNVARLSSTRRKLECARDDRLSSFFMCLFALFTMGCLYVFILFNDLVTIISDIYQRFKGQ